MTDAQVPHSSSKYTGEEDREEIIIVTDELVRPVDGVAPPLRQHTPLRDRDDEIDVTTISNSPNGMMPRTDMGEHRHLNRVTPSAMNLDNFIREDARMYGIRKMQSHLPTESVKDYRQAIDHDYVSSMSRQSGSSGARFGPSIYRQPGVSTTLTPSGSTPSLTPAVPVSPSAIHRRKRKGASVEHAANSDSDDQEEELFRSAKIEYTKAYNPENADDFACPRCPAQFESRVGLTNHLKLHGSQKKFPCTLCDFCCTNKKTMRQHRRIHGVVRRPPAKRMFVVTTDPPAEEADSEHGGIPEEKSTEMSPEKQEITATPVNVVSGIAKFASSSVGRKPAVMAQKNVSSTRQELPLSPRGESQQRTPARTNHVESPKSMKAAVPSKADYAVEELPPTLSAVGLDVTDEAQTTNQPIIRAIDFALKLNLDEHGNPLPLPQRDPAPSNQLFTLGEVSMAPPTSKSPIKSKSGKTENAQADEVETMPMLPLEMKNEETSDDDDEEDEQSIIGEDSKKATATSPTKNYRVKCKDCPFPARTVARLQPHLLGHTRETGYKCQFCTFKSESLGFLKRHINLHNEEQYTWPPDYVGDTQEHMEKLLAKERKRLALERHRKAEAQRSGAGMSKTKTPTVPIDDGEKSEKKDKAEEWPSTAKRGLRKITEKTTPETPSNTQPTRRSTRTSRPPKPLYTSPESGPRAKRVSTALANDTATSTAGSEAEKTQKSQTKKASPAKAPTAASTESASTAAADVPASSSSSTESLSFNQCKYCDYKTTIRAPAAVMIRHVLRRHKEETSKNV